MLEVDLDVGPTLQAERRRALVGSGAEEGGDRQDVPPQRPPARYALQLPQLLERVDPHVRVGADADPDSALADLFDRHEPVAEVCLSRRADADPGTRLCNQLELASVCMRGVHDRRVRTEAAGLREQLNRPEAVLRDALLDLARLLTGVYVQRKTLARSVSAEVLEPSAGAGADGVGGEADAYASRAHRLELGQVVGRGFLPEALEPTAPVGRQQKDELDPGFRSRLHGRVRL